MISTTASDTDTLPIRYTFEFEDGHCESHEVRLHRESLELCEPVKCELPEWTRLDNHKCAGCPLTSDAHPHCPAAVALANVSTSFGGRTSYTPVQVTVETGQPAGGAPTRTIARQAPLQEALFPLLGLRMATSGCPVLSKLRPMARFHLPFADSEETAYRAISMYLVGQFLRQSKGLPAEFDLRGLAEIYEQVHEVNLTFSKRLAQASSSDANINSLTSHAWPRWACLPRTCRGASRRLWRRWIKSSRLISRVQEFRSSGVRELTVSTRRRQSSYGALATAPRLPNSQLLNSQLVNS